MDGLLNLIGWLSPSVSDQVSTLEGVLEVRNEHFWTVGFGSLVRQSHARKRPFIHVQTRKWQDTIYSSDAPKRKRVTSVPEFRFKMFCTRICWISALFIISWPETRRNPALFPSFLSSVCSFISGWLAILSFTPPPTRRFVMTIGDLLTRTRRRNESFMRTCSLSVHLQPLLLLCVLHVVVATANNPSWLSGRHTYIIPRLQKNTRISDCKKKKKNLINSK